MSDKYIEKEWQHEIEEVLRSRFIFSSLLSRYSWHWEGIGVPAWWRRILKLWCNRFGHTIICVQWTADGQSEWCKVCDQERDTRNYGTTIHIPEFRSIR